VTLTRSDFVGVVRNAVSGLGLAPDVAMVTFPTETFLPGSDLAQLKVRKSEFYDALTRWSPRAGPPSVEGAAVLRVEGKDHRDVLLKANNLLLRRSWSDGLPLWPATREHVDWILLGSARPRTDVLGKFPPRGGITTIETCAIALAMAGGRPEYLPVLVAIVDACFDPALNFEQLQATSAGPFACVIVNGPISKQIRLNSGFGCIGPDPQHPAGASIGRALRLLQQNVGGALPGVGSMGCFGAMRYTHAVFGENEDGLPFNWLPHGTAQHGFAPGSNSISLIFATGVTNIRRRGAKKETPEQDALQGMYRIADYMRTPNLGSLKGYELGTPGVVVFTRIVAGFLAKLGWTQPSIREFLWQHSKIPQELLHRNGSTAWLNIDPNPTARASAALDPWPITAKAGNIVTVVAGGAHPTHAYWVQAHTPRVIGRLIDLPERFTELLESADRELGSAHPPLPVQ
jgi:hypothetical protein